MRKYLTLELHKREGLVQRPWPQGKTFRRDYWRCDGKKSNASRALLVTEWSEPMSIRVASVGPPPTQRIRKGFSTYPADLESLGGLHA